MKKLALIGASMLLAFGMQAEDRFANVTIKTVAVQGNVFTLFGAGGNIGVSKGEDGLLMIDDQFGELAPKIKAALKDLGDESPTYLINTHYHGDHTGSNAAFGADSLIMAHDNVRVRLVNSDTPGSYPPSALPVISYSNEASIFFNGEEIRLVHMPNGHTDGDTVVFFTRSDVVHMGDHFFRDRFPFVDLEGGGSVQGMTANVANVLLMITDATKVIPGHGSLAGKADLARFYGMLLETTALVQAGMDAGKSADELVSAGLSENWAEWGTGFINEENWIRTVYASLGK